MCWITVPQCFKALVVSSAVSRCNPPHAFLSKYSDRRRQCSSAVQNSSGWGGGDSQAETHYTALLFFLPPPVTSFVQTFFCFYSTISFSPPPVHIQTWWRFLCKAVDSRCTKTPFFLFLFLALSLLPCKESQGTGKVKATSAVQPGGREGGGAAF